MTTNRILLILFILFILVRLPCLDQLDLLHDEREIVLSGWSIAHIGKDLTGKPFPLVFENISPNNPVVAIYFAALWFLIIPVKTVFIARLPFVLVSSLIVFLSYRIIKLITGDEKKSLITTAILCFNPWIFHITRLALDIPLAFIFLFSGILMYLQKKKIISLFFFLLMAFTYQGLRLLLPFLLVYLEVFFLIKEKSWKNFHINSGLNILFFILLIIFTFKLEPTVSGNRLTEIIFFDSQKTAPTIDFKRITSNAPLVIRKLFDNKLTHPLEEMVISFARGTDISYLFKTGDYSAINGNASTGQFFFVFIVFYFLGIASLGRKSAHTDLYLLGLIPLGMIPTLLSTRGLTFSIRGSLSALGYSYLLALGLLFFHQLTAKFKFRKYLLAALTAVLVINLTYFIYGYYFRRPITVGELFYENERALSSFLLDSNGTYTVYHQSPRDMLLSYVFFKKDNLNIEEVQSNLAENNYSYGNFRFIKCNHKINYSQTNKTIVHEPCLEKKVYDLLSDLNNNKIKARIPYGNYSQKYAYFVME